MASPDVLPSLLQALPPRPPTPPRETIADTETQHRQLLGSQSLQPTPSSLHTPPGAHSPGSGISSSRRKRVEFSAKAHYQEPPVFLEGDIKKVPTPISLPSSNCKPIKSILKITYGPNPLVPDTDSTGANANLGKMLDSTFQQLAGADRDSRVDAYIMLQRALRASSNLPDRVALQEKMSLITQFIQRDVMAKTPAGTTDSSLVNQTLNLLVTLLGYPSIGSTMSHEFAIFIVDHCIRSFEDPSTSKEAVRHLMHVIASQSFSTQKVMTLDRVGRLVGALHKIEEHLKGKSIILSRLHIYRKLVTQCRQAMIIHADWIYDLFTDMLSELRDIRLYAINLGLEAGFTIAKEKSISRKTMEIFNQSNEEKKYIEFYQERLTAMAEAKSDLISVAQIWSVVILFLRCPIDRWNQMGRWLKIIQLCFNSSDVKNKVAANAAWCRLIYLMLMEDRVTPKTFTVLGQPLKSQLRQKQTSSKHGEEFRQGVLNGVRHMLYYTFKPHANLTLLDGHWDASVKELLAQMLHASTPEVYKGTQHATAILAGLFDCTTPRVWKEDRVTEKTPIQPEELPAIDPKWIRRNSARVFELVEPIMLKSIAELNDTASPTYKLWRNLVTAVASAAAKEIKVSLDTTYFVARALSLLQKIWNQGLGVQANGPEYGKACHHFLTACQTFLSIMVNSLGLLPFTEKQLSLNKAEEFVPLATPTHRPSKTQIVSRTPLKHLFSFLSTLPPNVESNLYSDFLPTVFAPFLANKSDKARMDLAQDLLSTIPVDAHMAYGVWAFIANNISPWVEAGHNSIQSGSGADAPVGHIYREIVRVLERAFRSVPGIEVDHFISFLTAIVNRVRDETGEAGVAIVVIEPLAKVLLDINPPAEAKGHAFNLSALVEFVPRLLAVAVQPRDRQAVDAARRRLWGSGPRQAAASFDTFDNLYKITSSLLEWVYKFEGYGNLVPLLLAEVGNFLERCNPQLVSKSLLALQEGLAPWIRDEKATNPSPYYYYYPEVNQALKVTWQKICTILAGYDRSQQLQLDSLEPLLCAAFESKHLHVVNSAVELWNRVFEDVEEIQYPEKLKAVLQCLRKKVAVDITLPGLEGARIERAPTPDAYEDRFFFTSEEDDIEMPLPQSKKPSKTSTPRATPRPSSRANSRPASARRDGSPAVKLPGTVSKKRPLETVTHERLAKVQKRNTPKPKLRHDDSQIQFAAVSDTSPLLQDEAESQALTDRQKEVRERQKETAVAFKEMRSSPTRKTRATSSRLSSAIPSSPQLPNIRRAATPEPTRSLEDYVSSTPTPRRGLPVAPIALLPDHDSDMADPPSSPPEPRRNPLQREIEQRSATKSLMDDWQFTSSPAGSPVAPRHAPAATKQPIAIDSDSELSDLEDMDDDAMDIINTTHDQEEPELGEGDVQDMVVEDSGVAHKLASTAEDSVLANTSDSIIEETAPVQSLEEPVSTRSKAKARTSPTSEPSTPRHGRIASTIQETPEFPSPAIAEPPSSDKLARTTRSQHKTEATSRPSTRASSRGSNASSSKPPPPTPTPAPAPAVGVSTRRSSARKATANTTSSFEGASDMDDSSLLRLVVELDGKVNKQEYEYRQVTDSPEVKKQAAIAAAAAAAAGGKNKRQRGPRRGRPSSSQSSSAAVIASSPLKPTEKEEREIPSTVPETIPEEPEVVTSSDVQEVVQSSQVSTTSGRGRKKRRRGNPGALAAARKRRALERESQEEQEREEEGQKQVQDEESEMPPQGSVDLSISQPPARDHVSEEGSVHDMANEATETTAPTQVEEAVEEEPEPEVQEEEEKVEAEEEDVVLEVESQIFQESAEGSRRQTQEPESEVMDIESAAPTVVRLEESTAEEDDFETAEEKAEEIRETPAEKMDVDEPAPTPAAIESPFKKILGFFRGGLEALKSAALTRSETIQAEDMFMDVRRELIEAEMRGRAEQ